MCRQRLEWRSHRRSHTKVLACRRPISPRRPWCFRAGPHYRDVGRSKNRPCRASHRRQWAGSSRRSPPRFWGSSPCSRRSVPRRPSRAVTARGPPVPTRASSSTGTRGRRHSPAERLSPGPWAPTRLDRCWAGRSVPILPVTSNPIRTWATGFLSGDERPCPSRAAGMGIACGRNAQSGGLANRLAQQVEQRGVDARVLDSGGREKQLHHVLLGFGVALRVETAA